MLKSLVLKKVKHKRFAAAAVVIVMCVIIGGCGGATSSKHTQHNMQNEVKAVNGSVDQHTIAKGVTGEHAGHNSESSAGLTSNDMKLEWRYSPERPKPGEKTNIKMLVYNKAGKPVEKFETNHEKLMHLIIVRDDLTEFNHVHPVYKGKGEFEVEAEFATGGTYKLFADFIPTGGNQFTETSSVTVAGEKRAERPLTKDASLTKVENDLEASLSISSLKAGTEALLTFTFQDVKTMKPITDLQPYLGAIGHVVILNEKLNRYLHVHPVDDNVSGPTAGFSTNFPEPGLYKIWGQFQRKDETFIINYTVSIE